jgi:hypothetical protein
MCFIEKCFLKYAPVLTEFKVKRKVSRKGKMKML